MKDITLKQILDLYIKLNNAKIKIELDNQAGNQKFFVMHHFGQKYSGDFYATIEHGKFIVDDNFSDYEDDLILLEKAQKILDRVMLINKLEIELENSTHNKKKVSKI